MHQDLPPLKSRNTRGVFPKKTIASMRLVYPIGSMYGIFTYIWLICMVNVGKYTIHGWYGYIYLHEWLMFTVYINVEI